METGGRSDVSFAVPQSDYPDIEWPAVVNGKNATLLALQYQLRDTQWWPDADIKAHQFRQIEHLVRHARKTVPYYAAHLDEAVWAKGLNNDIWQQVPVLGREELQAQGENLLSSAIPKEHGATTDQQSSGSTGRPVSVRITELHGLFFAALNIRHFQWQGLNFRESVAAIRAIRPKEKDHVRLNKPIPWVAGHASGPMHLFDVVLPVSQQVAWLVKQKPTYLLTMPSNLKAILDYMQAKGLSLPSIRKVMTMSEIITPELRNQCTEVLDVRIGGSYSAYEVGMIALQCPAYDHYHVQAESLLIEILDEKNQPCDVGEIGRVVITDLHNFAMPLIRYDIGDYAEVGPACPCGRGLPVLKRILGRKRNMVTYPSGDKSWPVPWLSSELAPIAPIKQIQLTQHTRQEIEVKLVTDRPLTIKQQGLLVALFQSRMHHPFDFKFVYVDVIERSAGGKFEDFISLID
jgi:phenylacetate-CoA ligase